MYIAASPGMEPDKSGLVSFTGKILHLPNRKSG